MEKGKGIALRFPRFIRERPDKNADDATTANQMADFYRSQQLANAEESAKSGRKDEDEDDEDIL